MTIDVTQVVREVTYVFPETYFHAGMDAASRDEHIHAGAWLLSQPIPANPVIRGVTVEACHVLG